MKPRRPLILLTSILAAVTSAAPRGTAANLTAAAGINGTGIALHRGQPVKAGNALISPWSIQTVMAAAFAGSAGGTKKEMNTALHFGGDEIHPAMKALSDSLLTAVPKGAELRTANRLYPATGCRLTPAFTQTLAKNYGAAIEPLDYAKPAAAADRINAWVSDQTDRHISNLVPPEALSTQTTLILVNAIYFNVPWQVRFTKELTKDQPFLTAPGMQKTVPLMFKQTAMRYARKKGFQMAALPYSGEQLQFTIILPDKPDGLAVIEKSLTPALLAEGVTMPKTEVRLTLPRFRIEPAGLDLTTALTSLGMKSAFSAAADFSGMTSDPVFISAVFHKAFIDVNEDGTEAAAATAALMAKANGHPHEAPHIVVRADHPFLFAIQHVPSGSCLFLGRLTDPAPAKAAEKTSARPKAAR